MSLFITRVSVPEQSDSYHMHRVVEDLFEGEEARKVFRVRDGSISVVSPAPPKETCFDRDVRVLHTMELPTPSRGTYMPFQLLFNPVRSYGQGQGKKSARKGVWAEEDAMEWLSGRLASGGVHVENLVVNRVGIQKLVKPNGMTATAVAHQAVGVLRVDDPAAFMNMVSAGIGGCKFMGYGMIEVSSMG